MRARLPLSKDEDLDCLQFIEIIPAENLFALLEPLVIQHETLDDELPEHFRSPDTELSSLIAVHPVAHGDDGVQVLVTSGLFFAVGGSCFQNGNN